MTLDSLISSPKRHHSQLLPVHFHPCSCVRWLCLYKLTVIIPFSHFNSPPHPPNSLVHYGSSTWRYSRRPPEKWILSLQFDSGTFRRHFFFKGNLLALQALNLYRLHSHFPSYCKSSSFVLLKVFSFYRRQTFVFSRLHQPPQTISS